MANHSSTPAMRTHINSMKTQKDLTLEDKPPRSEGVQHVLGQSRGQLLIALERMKWLGQTETTLSCGCTWW